ncbi:MAG: hypothetical protein WCD04_03345 [Terriglobia bacterium]
MNSPPQLRRGQGVVLVDAAYEGFPPFTTRQKDSVVRELAQPQNQ